MNKNVCKSAIKRGGRITPLIIPSEFTNGLGLMNPSILKVKNKYLVNIRWVGYALYHSEYNQKFQSPYGPLVYLNPEDDVTLTTVNYKCFQIQLRNIQIQQPTTPHPKPEHQTLNPDPKT